ncbi:MAG: endonuclease/exonuclease/phosphatase family protein [Pseudomonadota bacterium]
MKLLSWNVQWCRGVDGRVDPARIAREVRGMADADVICLQEVARGFDTLAGSVGEDQFALLAAAFPGYSAIEGIAVDVAGEGPAAGTRRQFGNLLLSRLPLRQAWRHLLPWPADPSHADMQRVAIEALIQTPDVGDLRVTTTHLAYYSAAQRLAQVNALRDLHAAAQRHRQPPERADVSRGPFHWHSRPGAGIVTGDFNCEPASPGHARMLAPFDDGTPVFCDAWEVAHAGHSHDPTVGLFDTVQWPRRFACDFVFVSSDLAPRIKAFEVDRASDASDHQALLLTLG